MANLLESIVKSRIQTEMLGCTGWKLRPLTKSHAQDGTLPTLFKLKLQAASPTHQFRLTAALAASIGLVMNPERTEVGEDAGWVVLQDLSISSRPTHRSEPIIPMTPFRLSNRTANKSIPQLGTTPLLLPALYPPTDSRLGGGSSGSQAKLNARQDCMKGHTAIY